jgi:hypothetical protein
MYPFLDALTLIIMTLSIMTLSIITPSIMTHSIMPLNIMTISKSHSVCDTQRNGNQDNDIEHKNTKHSIKIWYST